MFKGLASRGGFHESVSACNVCPPKYEGANRCPSAVPPLPLVVSTHGRYTSYIQPIKLSMSLPLGALRPASLEDRGQIPALCARPID